MSKLTKDQILKEDVKLEVTKFDGFAINKFLEETKKKQNYLLNLKNLDEQSLKLVVQL